LDSCGAAASRAACGHAQEAERARFIVDKALQEKKSVIIKAQGEAQSAKLIGAAIQDNPGFIQLRKLEAAREIAGARAPRSQPSRVDHTRQLAPHPACAYADGHAPARLPCAFAGTLSKSSNRLFLDGGSLLLDVQQRDTLNLDAFHGKPKVVEKSEPAPAAVVEKSEPAPAA
jgi:hypothetical protein